VPYCAKSLGLRLCLSQFPDPSRGIVRLDRSTLVNFLYDLSYDSVWANVGYLALFVAAFQVRVGSLLE
jgi:hypothetical protein